MSSRKVPLKAHVTRQDDVGAGGGRASGTAASLIESRRINWFERAYFLAVGLLAAAVGLPTYFSPGQAAEVLPFSVPPLHARLIGAMSPAGLAIMLAAVVARRWSDVRLVPAITAIWTGGLLLVTLLHLEAFDFATTQTQIWFGAYGASPGIGVWPLARHPRDGHLVPTDPPLPRASRPWLTV